MRKLLIALSCCVALAACQTAQDAATSITTANQTITQKVKSAQGYAVQLCGYLPIASVVLAIFNSNFSSDVATVGNAICNAITNRPLADGPGDRIPRVNGIVIRGAYVK